MVFNLVPGVNKILVFFTALLFTSASVANPSLLRLSRKLPKSPMRTISPLARSSVITSTTAYNTARISAPLTVLIFSILFVSCSKFRSPYTTGFA